MASLFIWLFNTVRNWFVGRPEYLFLILEGEFGVSFKYKTRFQIHLPDKDTYHPFRFDNFDSIILHKRVNVEVRHVKPGQYIRVRDDIGRISKPIKVLAAYYQEIDIKDPLVEKLVKEFIVHICKGIDHFTSIGELSIYKQIVIAYFYELSDFYPNSVTTKDLEMHLNVDHQMSTKIRDLYLERLNKADLLNKSGAKHVYASSELLYLVMYQINKLYKKGQKPFPTKN